MSSFRLQGVTQVRPGFPESSKSAKGGSTISVQGGSEASGWGSIIVAGQHGDNVYVVLMDATFKRVFEGPDFRGPASLAGHF